MLLYLIRHGEPDYSTDTLTEKGKKQAELCADRLAVSGIDRIFSSPMGRARETAQPLAGRLNLPVGIEEWAYEIGEESKILFPDGKMRTQSCLSPAFLHAERYRGLDVETSLAEVYGVSHESFVERYRQLSEGVDGFLAKLGYERRADGLYEAVAPNEEHVALFCHCGMMRILLSHIYHVPHQFFAATLFCNYTGITILDFDSRDGRLLVPQLFSYGDTGHLYANGERPNHYFTYQGY